MVEKINIEGTDVFLEDMGEGEGKLTISNTYGYNFSTYWGSMGCSLKHFIIGIDEYYFINRLRRSSDNGVFSSKLSVRNVRKFIKSDMKYELPWYKFMEAQKSLREQLNEIEHDCDSEESFVYRMNNLHDDVSYGCLDRFEKIECKDAIKILCEEPWNFIEKEDSVEVVFLKRFFPKLKKAISKQLHSYEQANH